MLHQKVGFIGFGNMAQAIVRSLLSKNVLKSSQILVTNRSPGKLKKAEELGVGVVANNEELIEAVDIVIVAVKPQDLAAVLEPIANAFHDGQILISLAAGIPIDKLGKIVHTTKRIVRVMPNTPIEIGEAVVGYCIAPGAESVEPVIRDLLDPLGYAVAASEGDAFEALTVSCGSGTGFIFELMQYWQEWIEEHGFSPEVARKMTVQTFLGGALLAQSAENMSLSDLQKKVVSKKGVTHAGLESMRELEVDRALRYSFEKAVLRDRELGR